MTTINSDGLKIQPQNLATVSPSAEDHFRLFSHDGTGTITAANGESIANSGFYLWDNDQSAWKPLKNTVTNTDWFAGYGPSHYLLDVEEDGTLLAEDVTAVDFTGHLNVVDYGDGTVTIDPTHNHDTEYLDITNDSLTVSAGSGLLGGGSVALGSSVSLDVDQGSGSGLDADLLDGKDATDVMLDIEDDGVLAVSDVSGIDFTGHLNVVDNGDGTVSIDPTHNHDNQYLNTSGDSMAGALNMAGNDLVDGTTSVWDSVNQYVPQSSLQNDSVTVTAGSGLSGGGSVALGNSVSLDVNFSRYTDSEAASAAPVQSVDGQTGNVNVSTETQLFQARGTNTNINNSNNVSWNNTVHSDSAYSFNGTRVYIQESGVYEIKADISYYVNNSRVSGNLKIQVNGNQRGVVGRSGYVRDNNGHNESSVHPRAVESLSSGDWVRCRGRREASSGSVNVQDALFTLMKIK